LTYVGKGFFTQQLTGFVYMGPSLLFYRLYSFPFVAVRTSLRRTASRLPCASRVFLAYVKSPNHRFVTLKVDPPELPLSARVSCLGIARVRVPILSLSLFFLMLHVDAKAGIRFGPPPVCGSSRHRVEASASLVLKPDCAFFLPWLHALPTCVTVTTCLTF